jgi:hypothetical protein
MYRKIGLFFLSLWLFFLLTIVITLDFPVCVGTGCQFIGLFELLKSNIIPLICVFCLLIGLYSYLDFTYKLKDATQMPFKIIKIENIDYEHLTFLTTYIVPLVCFNFIDTRYQIVLLILLIVIGIIYIRTDLFYANPTLALFNYRIYRIDGEFKDGIRNNIILITKSKLSINQRCDYIKLDNRIYYAKLKAND